MSITLQYVHDTITYVVRLILALIISLKMRAFLNNTILIPLMPIQCIVARAVNPKFNWLIFSQMQHTWKHPKKEKTKSKK